MILGSRSRAPGRGLATQHLTRAATQQLILLWLGSGRGWRGADPGQSLRSSIGLGAALDAFCAGKAAEGLSPRSIVWYRMIGERLAAEPRIDDVNEDYKARRRLMVPELVRRGLEYPFPWADLWDWYEAYSEESGGYRARRSRIRKLAAPLVERLHELASDPGIDDLGGLGEQSSDWTQIEGRLASMRQELAQAVSLDDLQDVGRRCREVVIDAARRVFDSTMVPEGTESPGSSDAKTMIELFLASRAGGSSRDTNSPRPQLSHLDADRDSFRFNHAGRCRRMRVSRCPDRADTPTAGVRTREEPARRSPAQRFGGPAPQRPSGSASARNSRRRGRTGCDGVVGW